MLLPFRETTGVARVTPCERIQRPIMVLSGPRGKDAGPRLFCCAQERSLEGDPVRPDTALAGRVPMRNQERREWPYGTHPSQEKVLYRLCVPLIRWSGGAAKLSG